MMNSQPTSFSTCPMPGVKNSNTIEPSTVSPLMALSRSDRLATLILLASAGMDARTTPSMCAEERQRMGRHQTDQTKQEANRPQPNRTPQQMHDPGDEIG